MGLALRLCRRDARRRRARHDACASAVRRKLGILASMVALGLMVALAVDLPVWIGALAAREGAALLMSCWGRRLRRRFPARASTSRMMRAMLTSSP